MDKQLAWRVREVFDSMPEDFDTTFRTWLRENWMIYESFHTMADKMSLIRDRYSARTVIENIRWHTDLNEKDNLFKINNNITPDMARMYNRINGRKFFSERRKYGNHE